MAAAAYVQQPQYAYADPSQPQLQQQVAPYPAGPVQTPVPAAQAPTAQAFYDEATQTWVQVRRRPLLCCPARRPLSTPPAMRGAYS